MGWIGGMPQYEPYPFQQSNCTQICTDEERARDINKDIQNARDRKRRDPERERKTVERELLKGLKLEEKWREEDAKKELKLQKMLKAIKAESVKKVDKNEKKWMERQAKISSQLDALMSEQRELGQRRNDQGTFTTEDCQRGEYLHQRYKYLCQK
jgi:hypothetical protein